MQYWVFATPMTLLMFSGHMDFWLRQALGELPKIFGAAVTNFDCLIS